MEDGKLPLGIMRSAIKKMDGFISDIIECAGDEDIDEESRNSFQMIVETARNLEAALVNTAMKEIGEEEFLKENIYDIDECDYNEEEQSEDFMDIVIDDEGS